MTRLYNQIVYISWRISTRNITEKEKNCINFIRRSMKHAILNIKQREKKDQKLLASLLNFRSK